MIHLRPHTTYSLTYANGSRSVFRTLAHVDPDHQQTLVQGSITGKLIHLSLLMNSAGVILQEGTQPELTHPCRECSCSGYFAPLEGTLCDNCGHDKAAHGMESFH